jgi:hypothetical protein
MVRILALVLSVVLGSLNPLVCFAEAAQAPQISSASQAFIEEGTPIRVKIEESLSTKTATEGQKLQFAVVEDILGKDGKTVVIKEGAPATGYLVNVDEKSTGKGGKLSIEITWVKAVDGSKVSLRCIKAHTGKNGAGVGAYILGYACLGLIGLGAVALFSKSKDSIMPAGTIITAFVDKDSTVALAPGTTDQTLNKPVAVTTVSGNIVSVSKPESQAASSPSSAQSKDVPSANKIEAEKPANSKTL